MGGTQTKLYQFAIVENQTIEEDVQAMILDIDEKIKGSTDPLKIAGALHGESIGILKAYLLKKLSDDNGEQSLIADITSLVLTEREEQQVEAQEDYDLRDDQQTSLKRPKEVIYAFILFLLVIAFSIFVAFMENRNTLQNLGIAGVSIGAFFLLVLAYAVGVTLLKVPPLLAKLYTWGILGERQNTGRRYTDIYQTLFQDDIKKVFIMMNNFNATGLRLLIMLTNLPAIKTAYPLRSTQLKKHATLLQNYLQAQNKCKALHFQLTLQRCMETINYFLFFDTLLIVSGSIPSLFLKIMLILEAADLKGVQIANSSSTGNNQSNVPIFLYSFGMLIIVLLTFVLVVKAFNRISQMNSSKSHLLVYLDYFHDSYIELKGNICHEVQGPKPIQDRIKKDQENEEQQLPIRSKKVPVLQEIDEIVENLPKNEVNAHRQRSNNELLQDKTKPQLIAPKLVQVQGEKEHQKGKKQKK